MTAKLDLSQTNDVITYLAQTSFVTSAVIPLSGGFSNFTFRLQLSTPFKGQKTLIFKHAKPYASASEFQSIKLAVERQDFENEALRYVKGMMLPPDSLVTVPSVYHYDRDDHVIIMEDCGEDAISLKQRILDDSLPDGLSRDIGTALGIFLATLHGRGSENQDALRYFDTNHDGKRLSAWVAYGRFMSTLDGDDSGTPLVDPPILLTQTERDMILHLAADGTSTVMNANTAITMGDFWPGNILVRLRRDNGGSGVLAVERIYIIDWELAKAGVASYDIGQFAGDIYMTGHFHPKTEQCVSSVLSAFLRSYAQERPLGETVAKEAAMRVGAHLIGFGPRLYNSTKERTREIVVKGVEHLLRACDGDHAWLERCIVGPLLN